MFFAEFQGDFLEEAANCDVRVLLFVMTFIDVHCVLTQLWADDTLLFVFYMVLIVSMNVFYT